MLNLYNAQNDGDETDDTDEFSDCTSSATEEGIEMREENDVTGEVVGLLEEEEEDPDVDDDDNSSSDEAGRVALAVDPSQLSGGSGELPQNGHDYLSQVQAERAKLPAVVSKRPPPIKLRKAIKRSATVLQNKEKQIKEQQDVGDAQSSRDETPCDDNKHQDADYELKYCDEILDNFRGLRAQLDAIRGSVVVVEEDYSDDRQVSEKQLKKEADQAEKRASNLIKLMELGQRPQVSTLIHNSQLELHMTLEKLANQCEITPNYSTIHSDWLYSIMAALREPIEPDICSTLRRLARICMAKRELFEKRAKQRGGCDEHQEEGKKQTVHNKPEAFSSKRVFSQNNVVASSSSSSGGGGENNEELVRQLEEEEYTSSLLIICIVRHYFGQADLK